MTVVAAAISGKNGRWLMQRRPLHKHHGGLWEFPGGKIEIGESPEEALIRELREELTIEVSAGALRRLAEASAPGGARSPQIVITLYTVADWSGSPVAEAGAELGWFVPEQIVALQLPPLDRELAVRLFADGA